MTHKLKLFGLVLLAVAALAALMAGAASAAFGLKDLDVYIAAEDGSPAVQAGSHPFSVTTHMAANTFFDPDLGKVVPDEEPKDVRIFFPPGFAGNPTAVPRCTSAEFLAGIRPACPDATALGVAEVEYGFPEEPEANTLPVYNLYPSPGKAAKIGFIVEGRAPVTVDVAVNPDSPHNVIAGAANISDAVFFLAATVTIWGIPAADAHDEERGSCSRTHEVCSVSLPETPFITLPTSCASPLSFDFEADSWQNPDPPVWFKASTTAHDNLIPPNPLSPTGCGKLDFDPEISTQPTTSSAESASGLDVEANVTDEGINNPAEGATADSAIKKTVLTLPEGVTINPSQAEGLGTCSEAQLAAERADSVPGEGCPQSSKIGTLEVETPLLEGKLLRGSLHVATPYENPFGTLVAVYMVIREPELGILVRLPVKVEPDPETGRLISTVEDVPDLPVSRFHLHFREGGRSPLVTPPACGTYTSTARFTPWSNPTGAYEATASFAIASGTGGGPCPAGGTPPFAPGFEAGTLNNDAGSYSPFYMRLSRRDGDQDLTRFAAQLPAGMIAKLAGAGRCSDASIAAAKARAGRAELAAPSCPDSSRIGRVLAGAGVGSELTYVPGSVYLAGPYNGAPLSVMGIVPAVAGPFDVGTVVTRLALRIDPRTAEVTVDGAASDPIPHILAGIPLKVREIRAYVDRPQFTLNPTSCEPFAVGATLWGGGADVFGSADDAPLALSSRFQVANCASLGFAPRLSLLLRGGAGRGAHPALTGTYLPRAGDANLEQLVLRLPRSAFLDQGHIRTICTRVQFAAGGGNGAGCPAASIYGTATAYTPLLDEPLSGPVYLRSSDHDLPDFVAALHGLIDIEAVARIDSKRGGIRATFSGVPDAPLSKVVVQMQGAKKGLIVNSRNLCGKKSKAEVDSTGQNGKAFSAKPMLRADCRGKRKSKRHGAAQGRAGRPRDPLPHR